MSCSAPTGPARPWFVPMAWLPLPRGLGPLAVLLALAAAPAPAEEGRWSLDGSGAGAEGPLRAGITWEGGRSALLDYDYDADQWRLTVFYPGEDRMGERLLSAYYGVSAEKGRPSDSWESVMYAEGTYRVDFRGGMTIVRLDLPFDFIPHVAGADYLYLDAGNDAMTIPLDGSARTVAAMQAGILDLIEAEDRAAGYVSNAEARSRGEAEEPLPDWSGVPVAGAIDHAERVPGLSAILANECPHGTGGPAQILVNHGIAPPDDMAAFCAHFAPAGAASKPEPVAAPIPEPQPEPVVAPRPEPQPALKPYETKAILARIEELGVGGYIFFACKADQEAWHRAPWGGRPDYTPLEDRWTFKNLGLAVPAEPGEVCDSVLLNTSYRRQADSITELPRQDISAVFDAVDAAFDSQFFETILVECDVRGTIDPVEFSVMGLPPTQDLPLFCEMLLDAVVPFE